MLFIVTRWLSGLILLLLWSVAQCDLLELKEGKRMVLKFLRVIRSMSLYCSAGLTSRYHIWNIYKHLFKVAIVCFGKNGINLFVIFFWGLPGPWSIAILGHLCIFSGIHLCLQSIVKCLFLVLACKSHIILLDIGTDRRKWIQIFVSPFTWILLLHDTNCI